MFQHRSFPSKYTGHLLSDYVRNLDIGGVGKAKLRSRCQQEKVDRTQAALPITYGHDILQSIIQPRLGMLKLPAHPHLLAVMSEAQIVA